MRTVEHVGAVEIPALGVEPKRVDGRGPVAIRIDERGEAGDAARRRRAADHVKEQIGAGRRCIDQDRFVAEHFVEVWQMARRPFDVNGKARIEMLADSQRSVHMQRDAAVRNAQRRERDDV